MWHMPPPGPGMLPAPPGLFLELKGKRRGALQPRRPPSPVGNGEAVVAEEVGGLLAVPEEQHAHHAVQREDGGALRAHGVGHVEGPERVPADLK